jgi:hypothetical protein
VAALTLAAALASASAGWSAVAVAGHDRLEVSLPADAPISSYSNNGYLLEVEDGRARVTVDVQPLVSQYPFEAPTIASGRAQETAVERLSHALTAGSETRYEAVSRILGWISDNVRYHLDRAADQSPEAVLKRREAYCTGSARLAVSLLEAVGIEAREVAGLLLESPDFGGAEAPPVGFHRWIEVFYPDRGWVFSDPMASHHFVPATYIPLSGARASADLPERLGSVLRSHDLWPIDRYDHAAASISARKNSTRQLAGTVRIRWQPQDALGNEDAEAWLEGEGLRRRLPLTAGNATFTGVEPGLYKVKLWSHGLPVAESELLINDRRRVELRVPECLAGHQSREGVRPCAAPSGDGT